MADRDEDVAKTIGLNAPRRTWWKRTLIVVLLAALLSILWFGVASNDRQAAAKYITSEVTEGSFVVLVTATGTVEPTNLFEISSELSGTVESVNVDFNEAVEEGTVLASLDTDTLEAALQVSRASLDSAIARVAVAEASLTEARQTYELSRELEQRGVTAHQSFIVNEANFARAKAELQSAKAERALAEANLDIRQTELEKACICSPVAGIVLDRAVDPGQIVASSLSAPVLFTVAEDLTEMELQVSIDEADIGRVRVGQTAEFTVDAYDDRRFPAEIVQVRFAPEIVDGVVTYKAILRIDNAELILRPGMTATADITVAEVEQAMVVANAALRFSPPEEQDATSDERSGLLGMLIPDDPDRTTAATNMRTVWVLAADGPQEIEIEPGLSNGKFTEVLSGKIALGDQLVIEQLDE
ncbi:MAG: efflux RND transporter periplasmic adaptor subunit [Paracoccaceae bacterium]|nr:efflux RND transporter periplasmic adaptor subunit [Paracoccaceae bacterium]